MKKLKAVVSGGMASARVSGGKGLSSTEAAGAQVLQMRDQFIDPKYQPQPRRVHSRGRELILVVGR
jgi:hypothetical protein